MLTENQVQKDIEAFQARLRELRSDLIHWMSRDKKSLRLSQWETLTAITSGVSDIENQWSEIATKYLNPGNQ